MAFDPTGWTGYKVITVANTGSTVTDYQQVLQLTAADIDFGLWQADGDDVRIVSDASGDALPHWTRLWDSTKNIAEVWFLADSLTGSGSTTFRLYYGNAGASSTSSYDTTMQKLGTDGGAALALYHFDEGTGTPADATGNTTATLVGSPTWHGSDVGGWGPKQTQNFGTGNAMVFDGSSQYATFGTLLNTVGSAYSIEFVMQFLTDPAGGGDSRLLTKFFSTGGTYNAIDLYYENSTGKLKFRTISGSIVIHDVATVTGDALSSFKTGFVYRIVIQQSSTHGKQIWINGALEGEDTTATAMPSSGSAAPFTIGAYNDGSVVQHTHMLVDEFRVLSRWQTRDEIVCNWTRRKYFSGISTQQGRLTRFASNPILAPAGGSVWDADCTQEPVVYTDGSTWDIWYSGLINSDGRASLGLAQRSNTSPEGAFTRSGSAPKLGLGNGGVTNNACHAGVYFESGTWHFFYSDNITATANLRRATSTDRTTLTDAGQAISAGQESGVIGYANPKVFKEGSTYHMMVEGRNAAGTLWVQQHFTNTAVDNDGGWVRSAAGILTTLEYYTGHSYSHPSIQKIGDKYHMWYHTNTTGTVVPSVIVHAVSADLDNWLPDFGSGPVLDQCKDGATIGGQLIDQIADPTVIEAGGNTYLFYDVSSNTSGVRAKICVARYAGTVADFVVDNPSVSSITNAPASLALSDALHAHAADSITLTTSTALVIADAAHAHGAEAVVLGVTGATTLTVADATHAHDVDGIVLSAQSVLAIQDALHAHAADSITLDASGAAVLLLADALHAHTADGLALTVDAWLVVADALHAHRVDAVVLTLPGAEVLSAPPIARRIVSAVRALRTSGARAARTNLSTR